MRCSIFIALLFAPLLAEACKCIDAPPVTEQFDRFDQVFLGQISDIRTREANPPLDTRTKFDVIIGVIDIYKGNPTSEVLGEVTAYYQPFSDPVSKTSCSTGIHRDYLFVVFRNEGETPVFSACSQTIYYMSSEHLHPLEELRER